jgi:hypothetical protein
VRVTRVAGTEGGGVPAITQSDGTTWDVPLYQATITTGGAITLTDERSFVRTPMAAGYKQSINPGDDVSHTVGAWNSIGAGVTVTLTQGAWLVMGALVFENSSSVVGTRGARIMNTTSAVQAALGAIYSEAAVETKSIPVRPTVVAITATNVFELQFFARDAGDTVYGGSGSTGLDREGTGLVALRLA